MPLPVLVQHVKALGLDAADGDVRCGVYRVGWADRGGPGHPEDPGRAMDQGWDLLKLLGTDLEPHARLPLGTAGASS